MPRKVVRKERAAFEKVSGSDIWWIRHKVAGVAFKITQFSRLYIGGMVADTNVTKLPHGEHDAQRPSR